METKKKKQNRAKDTWNGISGVMHIFGNEFGKGKNTRMGWSVSLPVKDRDGEITGNYYIKIRFAGKAAEEPATDGLHIIHINNAFFATDAWTGKDGTEHTDLVLVILDNSVEDETE